MHAVIGIPPLLIAFAVAIGVVSGGTYALDQLPAPPPVASPAEGTYDIGQTVTLTMPQPGFHIFYTLDGSEPTEGSTFYTEPIVLDRPTTLKAKGYQTGYSPTLLIADYAIRVAPPVVTPAAGEYDPMPVVTMSAGPSVTIRYTTDRTEPTASSTVYTGAFPVAHDTTVKAQAHLSGWAPSRVVTQSYFDSTWVPQGSAAVVTLGGATEIGLSAVGGSVSFVVQGAALSPDPDDHWAYRNGTRLPPSQVQLQPNGVNVVGALVEGRNELELEGMDSNGYMVYDRRVVWAGSRVLNVTVWDPTSQPIAGATVTVSPEWAGNVTATGATGVSGQVAIQRLPATSVLHVRIDAAGYRSARQTVPVGQSSLTVRLHLAKEDFSSGS